MRGLIILLAFLFIGLSSANCQVNEYDHAPDLLDIVQRAFKDIVNLTDVGLKSLQEQKDIFFKRFEDLTTHVGITGPIPAVFQIIYYWFDNYYTYSNKQTDIFWQKVATILKSIHYQIAQLTRCLPYDLNQLIYNNIMSLESEIESIRDDSKERLITILNSGRDVVLRLHQLAVNDCGANLEKYNKEAIAIPTQIIAKLKAEFDSRNVALLKALSYILNNIVANIRQSISARHPVCLPPPISPTVCLPPVISPPVILPVPVCPPQEIPPLLVCSPPDVEPPPTCELGSQ